MAVEPGAQPKVPASRLAGRSHRGRGGWPASSARHESEAEFSDQVRTLIKMLPRLISYHTHDSRRSDPGFPDLVIVGPGGVLFRELKTVTGKVTKAQSEWLTKLREAGCDASVWRPADISSGRIWKELREIAWKRAT